MPLLCIWLVIVGLFETPATAYSFTGSRDVFHLHLTPQMWTASDSTAINEINGSKFFPLFRPLWKNSRFGAVSTNESESDLRYAVADVCRDNESYLETGRVATRKGGCPEDERLDEFSNVVTNSGGELIGGSCTGGLFLLFVVIYFFYRLLRDDPSVHPTSGHVAQADAVTNQNRSSCPRCQNAPSSPPPTYSEVLAMGECADFPCACMSAPPANSKKPTTWTNK